MTDKTRPVSGHIPGNPLFGRAAFAIGLDGFTSRTVVRDALATVGGTPDAVTLDQLVAALDEIERLLRAMVPSGIVWEAIAGLHKLVDEERAAR